MKANKITVIVTLLLLAFGTPTNKTVADTRVYTAEEVEILAKCVWGEYRGEDDIQVAAVAWCILNRVDDPRFGNSIKSVVTSPYQFSGYNSGNPIDTRILNIVYDVLARWQAEPQCCGDIGRVLPKEYVYFRGNGKVNLYRVEYNSNKYWNWECSNPYVLYDK